MKDRTTLKGHVISRSVRTCHYRALALVVAGHRLLTDSIVGRLEKPHYNPINTIDEILGADESKYHANKFSQSAGQKFDTLATESRSTM